MNKYRLYHTNIKKYIAIKNDKIIFTHATTNNLKKKRQIIFTEDEIENNNLIQTFLSITEPQSLNKQPVVEKYVIKLQYQETFLIYNEKLEQFEWLKGKYEYLPDNAFLTKKQFDKAQNTVLKNLINYLVFTEEN